MYSRSQRVLTVPCAAWLSLLNNAHPETHYNYSGAAGGDSCYCIFLNVCVSIMFEVWINFLNNKHNIFRSRHVSDLLSPLNTVLDDSIGCALWFASKGYGQIRTAACQCQYSESKNYASLAKVSKAIQLYFLTCEGITLDLINSVILRSLKFGLFFFKFQFFMGLCQCYFHLL